MPATIMYVETLLCTAAILLVLAASGGLLMVAMLWQGAARPPDWLVMGHGLMAAAGLTLLGYAVLVVGAPALAQWAFALLLVAAAVGGLLNLQYHQKRLALPIPLLLVHVSLAPIGLVLLLLHVVTAALN